MCLIAFAIDAHADCPLLVAANRDEYLARPAAGLQRWRLDDGTEVIGGRDLREGGTWMGITPGGRVAWLTNVRRAGLEQGARSRGELVARWLGAASDAEGFAADIDAGDYGGFNLVVGDLRQRRWHWLSNCDPTRPHEATPARLHLAPVPPGLHTLSNASLNTPWPKARRLAQALEQALEDHARAEALLADALTDTRTAGDEELPRSGVPIEFERALSSPFVHMPQRGYGTRCSSVLRWGADGRVQFDEWTHIALTPSPSHSPSHSPPLAPSFSTAVHRRERLTVLQAA
jgi:uncharacterized protein with NRDE domain